MTEGLRPVAALSGPTWWWTDAECARVVRLCATITGDASAAEDLAQETFLEAWRSRHKLTRPEGVTRWLNAIARNVCRRWASARVSLPRPVGASALDIASPARQDDVDAVLEREASSSCWRTPSRWSPSRPGRRWWRTTSKNAVISTSPLSSGSLQTPSRCG